MRRQPLDLYDDFPPDMKAYLRSYGWHFNRKACEFAVSLMEMKDEGGKKKKIAALDKDKVDELLKRYGVQLEDNTGHDYVYVANMCKADYLGRSVPDESHMALYVKDVIDDVDAGDGTVMRRWYASMVAKGEVIDWEDIL